jgi:hypothetical protein
MRYRALRAAAQTSLNTWQTAVSGPEAQQRVALQDARRWGITPLTVDNASLATQVSRARDALSSRLQAAPAVAQAAGLTVVALARAVAELASPEGRIPVLARHQLSTLPVTLVPEPATPSPARVDLDPDWLEVVAAVRAPMARLEAFQLEQRALSSGTRERTVPSSTRRPPDLTFRVWTNRPGDPWQQAALHSEPSGLISTPRLVAAFGPAGVLDPGADPSRPVALGLLDSWSETVPATDHATSVAFHMDAPTARAPQAILIAIPPVLDGPCDTATLVQVVAEARALARVRAVMPSDLDGLAATLPLTWLPKKGTTGIIELERV